MPFTPFTLVVFLGGAPGDQLHAARNLALTAVMRQKMDMIGGDDVIEHTQAIAFPGLKQPLPPALAVSGELEQKFLLMAAVREMPDIAR